MSSKKIVIGNWKMNPPTLKEAEKLFGKVSKAASRFRKTDIVICAPFIYLEKLKKLSKKISLGAQNAFYGEVGAFTGEVSGEMLYNIGVRYVILGHSERRALGEGNEEINKKLKSALGASLTPILCVGENSRDDNHEYFNVVKNQVEECLRGVKKNQVSKIIFVYEPVWSISSTPNRKDATPENVREMIIFIRKTLSDFSSPEVTSKTRIIYGGSVTDKDALSFLEDGGADGVLPGRASLTAEKFIEIIRIADNVQ